MKHLRSEWKWIIAIAVIALAWTIAPVQGFDFWFYLCVGRSVLEEGGIPWELSYLGTTDSLAFHRYADHAWLGSVIFYLFFKSLGPLGIILLRSLLLSGLTTLTYLNCRLIGVSPRWAFLWATLGLWSIRTRFLPRSYLLTDLCAAILVMLMIAFWKKRQVKPFLVAVVGLFCLWSNLHQGVLAGYIMLLPWVLFNGHSLRLGVATFLAAITGSLLRPHGSQFPRFIYDHFSSETALADVVEWAPLGLQGILENLGLGALIAIPLVILGVKKLLQEKPPIPPPWAFLVLIGMFFFAALRSGRAVSEVLPIVFPLSAAYFPSLAPPRWTFPALAVALGSLLFVTHPNHNWKTLTEVQERYPFALSLELRDQSGQVFNSFEYGNFLAFQGIPPFIHGMTGLYQEELLKEFQSILRVQEGYKSKLDKYQVTSCLLHFPTEVDATENLVEALFESPDWKLIAWDDQALLFVRGPSSEGLTACRPWRIERWNDEQSARVELENLVKVHPSARAFGLLSELASKRSDWTQAKELARRATEENPDYYLPWMSLGLAAAKTGDLKTLLEASAQGVQIAPKNPKAHFNRGLALISQSQSQTGIHSWWSERRGRYHLNRTLSLDPQFEPARQILKGL